jgi:DNA-binding response OmpR family regulator
MTGRSEHHILVVEDNIGMREGVLMPGLKEVGFNVVGAGSAAEAYRCMLAQDFSVFILDIDLPGESGLTIAKHLRTVTEAGIVLTGHKRESNHIYGLDVGADVCITKPIDIDMLTATVRSLLRRLDRLNTLRAAEKPAPSWRFEMQDWYLASPRGVKVRLTHAERRLIEMLAASPGETVARDTIISKLARDIHDFDPHRLEMLVHRLRRKVLSTTNEQLPLNAVRGIGYVLLPGA